jgi:hypothetical protein
VHRNRRARRNGQAVDDLALVADVRVSAHSAPA